MHICCVGNFLFYPNFAACCYVITVGMGYICCTDNLGGLALKPLLERINQKLKTKVEEILLKDFNRLLIEKDADVNLIDGKWTPLTRAIVFDKKDMVKILIENGANLNLLNPNVWSPIQTAISKENFEILTLLIEKVRMSI